MNASQSLIKCDEQVKIGNRWRRRRRRLRRQSETSFHFNTNAFQSIDNSSGLFMFSAIFVLLFQRSGNDNSMTKTKRKRTRNFIFENTRDEMLCLSIVSCISHQVFKYKSQTTFVRCNVPS